MEDLKNKLHNIFDNNISIKKRFLFIIMFVVFLNIIIISLIGYYIYNYLVTNQSKSEYDEIEEFKNSTIQKQDNTEQKIIIYIIGEVNNSGVYELEENSRISDAIEKAGGVTPDADLNKINLAYQLFDGEKIKIPSIKEENDVNNIIEDEDMEYIEDELEYNSKESKVNINTADISKLQTLPGIGESIAQKIIDYREQNGNFKNVEDLKNVSGIGENKYNQIKDYIKAK